MNDDCCSCHLSAPCTYCTSRSHCDLCDKQVIENHMIESQGALICEACSYDRLNEGIAQHFGWRPEGDFHDNPDEWEGWRDPEGERGFVDAPDFLNILQHMVPALEKLWDSNNKD